MRRSDIQRQYFLKDGISAPTQYLEMRADMHVIAHFCVTRAKLLYGVTTLRDRLYSVLKARAERRFPIRCPAPRAGTIDALDRALNPQRHTPDVICCGKIAASGRGCARRRPAPDEICRVSQSEQEEG
jgi:hypothetical protein